MTRLLLVEDDPLLRKAFVRFLREHYEVTAVESAPEALKLLVEDRVAFHVALTDLALGDEARGGLRVVAACQFLGVPVVLMSGHFGGVTEDRRPPVWLDKPVEPKVLLEAIERAGSVG